MLKFTRRSNDNYGDFAGDDEYYGGGFDDVQAEEPTDAGFEAAPAPMPADAPAYGQGTVALKIVNPKGYEEASEIADFLMNGNTVLLNIEGMARENAIRLLDYLAGATHAVGGLMTKVGKTTIVVAPKNVDVSSIEAMVGEN